MKNNKAQLLLATACVTPALGLIVAWQANGWTESNQWLMQLAALSIAMVLVGITASIVMARGSRREKAVQRHLANIIRMDTNELSSSNSQKMMSEIPNNDPWHSLVDQLAKRELHQAERVEAAEMHQAALEVRIRRTADTQKQMEAILSGLNEPVLAVDPYDEVLLANPSAEQMFDFDLDQSEERMLRNLVQCEELLDLLGETRGHAAREKSRDIQLSTDDNDPRWFRVSARAIPVEDSLQDPNADIESAAVIVFRDIEAQKDNQRRNAEFVSSVSHEMKTPLSGIKAYVELLADGDAEDEETTEEFLEVINSQADRLQRLIDNLLNLARIEAGVVEVSKQSQSLNDLLEEALSVVQPAAEAKNIRLGSELSSMYLGVLADRDMLLQAAINLLSNAIKYTPEGESVVLRSRMIDDDIQFEVEDHGVGLSDEDQQRVFEKFYRVKKDKSMATGTGLGLPLAKHIVEDVHRGQLAVESELGEGSTFSVRLPCAGQIL